MCSCRCGCRMATVLTIAWIRRLRGASRHSPVGIDLKIRSSRYPACCVARCGSWLCCPVGHFLNEKSFRTSLRSAKGVCRSGWAVQFDRLRRKHLFQSNRYAMCFPCRRHRNSYHSGVRVLNGLPSAVSAAIDQKKRHHGCPVVPKSQYRKAWKHSCSTSREGADRDSNAIGRSSLPDCHT